MRGGRLGALGVASGGVVVIRGLADSPTAISQLEPVFDFVVAFFGVVVATDLLPQMVGDFALWAFYTAIFYRGIPALAPESFEPLTNDRPLVAILAILSLAFAVVVTGPVSIVAGITFSPVSSQPGSGFLHSFGILIFAGLLGLTAYTWLRFESPFNSKSAPGRVLRTNQWVSSDSQVFERYRDATGLIGRLSRAFIHGTVPMMLVVLCLVLGGIAGLAAGFSPLPELLFLLLSVAIRVPVSAPISVTADFEYELQQLLGRAQETEKGFAASLVLFLSLLFALGTVALGMSGLLRALSNTSQYLTLLSGGDVGIIWTHRFHVRFGFVGAYTLVVTAGVLFFWFWLRMARRLHAFARAWHGRADVPVKITRPYWSATVPSLLLSVGLSVPASTSFLASNTARSYHAAVGTLWPLGILLGIGWMAKTMRATPQPPITDSIHIPVGFILQLIPLAVLFPFIGAPFGLLRTWAIVLIPFLYLCQVYFSPDIDRQFERWGSVIHLGVAGLVLPLGSIAAVGRIHWIALVGSILCFFGAGFTFFEDQKRRES